MKGQSQGEKIKKLRLDLGLKQEDLTNHEVSKSLISMIEKGKRSLTLYTANIIANSLNKYYKSMGKEITAEFLMETDLDKVRREIKTELDYLNSIIETEKIEEKLIIPNFESLLALTEEWDIKEDGMAVIALRGKCYYSLYKYNQALKDLSTVLEYYIEVKNYGEVARIYNFMGSCYYMQMAIDRGLDYFAKSYEIAVQHDIHNKSRVKIEAVFNMVLCYRKLEKFDMVIQNINLFKSLDHDYEVYDYFNDQVTLLEANTYRDVGNFEKAEKLYEKLIQRGSEINVNTLFLAYINISIFYRENQKVNSALDYINKGIEIAEKIEDNYYKPVLFKHEAICYVIFKNYTKVIELLEMGLIEAQKIERKDTIIDIYFAFVELYIRLEDYNKALYYLQQVEKVITDNNIKTKVNELYSFYIDVYISLGDIEKSKMYTAKMRSVYLVK
ncbi:helix-turn-helix domain-containing protein [Alkaliphilus transvaalensis]|uniref:helix-turn-helix domain-containing protein n=1 Tax=Alkaliphilus transvaalensis TaxID=114628 RepID=UPI00047BDA87|nr:helix-turn-helix transcriptional regulator [Alkaliphilus transvaalensis]